MAFLSSVSCLWDFSWILQLLWYKSEKGIVLCFTKHHAMKTYGVWVHRCSHSWSKPDTEAYNDLHPMAVLFQAPNRRSGQTRASVYTAEKNPYPWQGANLASSVFQPTAWSLYWAIPAQFVLHLMVCVTSFNSALNLLLYVVHTTRLLNTTSVSTVFLLQVPHGWDQNIYFRPFTVWIKYSLRAE
jgi:hypothetical protein